MKNKNYKKKIICSIMLLSLCGCAFQENKTVEKQETVTEKEEKDFIEPYLDENPIQLGLYQNNNNIRTLISNLDIPWTLYQDIISLEVYYTKEETLTGNQKELWNQYLTPDQNLDSYHIGYHISFQTKEQTFEKTLLKPSDGDSIFEYIQIYLYDDIHQENGWYDHITDEEQTENTKLTSIKLTASTRIDEITSPIIITAFTYDSDDFDESGNYRGNSQYQVTITRK